MNDTIKNLQNYISLRGRLELLAEEASELSQAALKMIRVLPTNDNSDVYPVNLAKYNLDICEKNLISEFEDVLICSELLDMKADKKSKEIKIKKMLDRITNAPIEEIIPKRPFDQIEWDNEIFEHRFYDKRNNEWILTVDCKKFDFGFSDSNLKYISQGIIFICHTYGHEVEASSYYSPYAMITTYIVRRIGDYNKEENEQENE